MDVELYPASRLELVRDAVRTAGLDAVLLTPGPDLRYVTGYDAKQLERLTCLAVPAHGDPALFVPRLELPAAQASPAGSLGLEIIAVGGDRRIRSAWWRPCSGASRRSACPTGCGRCSC